ncbi:hypothetical protein HNP55_001856 [Paucibacter oligotrophus]|uniref:Putative DNA-binding domain-containing protein n=1 Tax=Roseateles oligotrophus TaxID=1769250 RepID=A0A840LDD3_9BURK|nr:DNA-binding domain-containing protein [Roseateles oligotrophus]MBB4843337.1 hypothetical protein [Roseateles oligotrophus]
MSELQNQQQALRVCLQEPETDLALARGQTLLRPGREGSAGLLAYREAYRARLVAALRDNYTVLQRLLGDEDFDKLALRYLQVLPSRQPSIRWFGDKLVEFLAGPLYEAERVHPALIDFARMDWALRTAFDGPHAPPFQAASLAGLAPEAWAGLRFELQPSVQLLRLGWAIEPSWRLLRAWEPDSFDAAPELPEPQAHAHVLLVWRQDLETRWRSLAPAEARLLQAVAAGQPFAALCELALADLPPGQPPQAAAQAVLDALGGWVAEGLLAA